MFKKFCRIIIGSVAALVCVPFMVIDIIANEIFRAWLNLRILSLIKYDFYAILEALKQYIKGY